jgi:hypothetical protein
MVFRAALVKGGECPVFGNRFPAISFQNRSIGIKGVSPGWEWSEPMSEKSEPKPVPKPREVKGPQPPDWSDGLKRLYDSVVEEPLPDSFKELLSRLDDGNK